ncbi:hypothetical protein [Pseudoalteromonas maricaloris]|uniref:hypothetical protein n=1 Tax=Pseudoalteromonas maricaloris TaxID=184924 RepID=UPI003C2A566D
MKLSILVSALIIFGAVSVAFAKDDVPASSQGTCVGSSQNVVRDICKELERAELPEKVKHSEYRYTNQKAGIVIEMEPAAAFRIEPVPNATGTAYSIRIVDASVLFRKRGGLVFPVTVSLKEMVSGGAVGTIRIEPDSKCETILEYKQAGQPIDLDILASEFTLDWQYPDTLLTKPFIEGKQVRISRRAPGSAALTLVVHDGDEEIARVSRQVLDCDGDTASPPIGESSISETMTPKRCYKPLSVRMVDINAGKRFYFDVQNVCSVPIKCSWGGEVSHYLSQQDAENDLRDGNAGRSVRTSGRGTFTITIPARSQTANGTASGSFDIVTSKSVIGQKHLNYWHRLTIAECEWFTWR